MAKSSVPSNVTNKSLYSRVKSEAKKKFDVYPSAYANSWLVKTYKKRGGGYSGPKKAAVGGIIEKGNNGFIARGCGAVMEENTQNVYPKLKLIVCQNHKLNQQ